jgi:signal transduction histidine kinase/ActR/RegA family two-component response regulator
MEQRKILLIEGNSDARANLRGLLGRDRTAEYSIVELGSAQGALQWLRTGSADCLIIGNELPDGSGVDLLSRSGDESGHPPLPAVLLVPSLEESVLQSAIAAGADEYVLQGECTPESLRLAVNGAICHWKMQRQLEQQRAEIGALRADLIVQLNELRETKEDADRASAAKDDFLAMLSHELRTPLTPVLSIVSATLGEGNLSPDQRETFQMVQRNIELEARLIDDLLDLTQIVSGRLSIERRPVDIHACIQSALDICQQGFIDRQIAVWTEFGATHQYVLGDSPRLHQVLWNLVKNAVKFTAPGGRVDIVTSNEDSRVVVEIRDTGVGIEEERLESIFGAFTGAKPQAPGTGLGLGLAITRAIVAAHNGEIRAFSSGRNRGASFRVSLPGTDQEPEAKPATEAGGRNYRGHTVLVVEDHEDTRRVLSRALRRKGFGVTVAAGVESALEQYAASRPDLVICDIGLPDGTGWDVMRRLREAGPVRAIAVSGFGMEHDVQRSREAGFIAHLTKPVDFPRLEAALSEALRTNAPAVHQATA